MQETFVMLKPDAVRRGLIGSLIGRLEDKGLTIKELQLREVERTLAERHYAVHRERPFYTELVDFITEGPVVVMRVAGREAVEVVRRLMGATDPKESAPGTIRGDFALDILNNLIHGSDAPETAEQEIKLFFGWPGG